MSYVTFKVVRQIHASVADIKGTFSMTSLSIVQL